jgi:hypothetical protein
MQKDRRYHGPRIDGQRTVTLSQRKRKERVDKITPEESDSHVNGNQDKRKDECGGGEVWVGRFLP